MQLAEIEKYLDKPKPDPKGGFFAFCPCHPDGTKQGRRSLSVQEKNGKLLVHCFAGCHNEDILKAYGLSMSDLFTDNNPQSPRKTVDLYDYTDSDGNFVYQVVRKYPKNFPQRRPDGKGGWLWNMEGVNPLPYRLPALQKALKAGETVYIVEGEKDVHSLEKIGLIATTNNKGAGNWEECHSRHFPAGAEVVILPDNDEPGRSHAQKIYDSLTARGCNVKIFNLPGLPPKGDVTNWLEGGGTKEELLKLIINDGWSDPEPLSKDLPKVEPMEIFYIPDGFQRWLVDIADRMQAPLDYVAVTAIVMAGSVIGAGCGIRPKEYDNWLVVPNLWGMAIGRPGMFKSPAMNETLKPLHLLEADARNEYKQAERMYNAKLEAYKSHKTSIKKQMENKGADREKLTLEYASIEEPEKLHRRRYITNDATIEKISELLNENPRGILFYRDELMGQLVTWEKAGHESDRQFFLEAWNGKGSYTTDRIGRGTIDCENLCVSLLGTIQPDKLLGYLRQTTRDQGNDGLVQRFQLAVYPDEADSIKIVDVPPDISARNRAYNILKKLAEADFVKLGATVEGDDKIPFFHFSAEAQEIFNQWYLELRNIKIALEQRDIVAEHLSKYASLMPSLALIFHLIDVVSEGVSGAVSVDATLRACAMCKYLESHARRVYGMLTDATERATASLGEKVKAGVLGDSFTARDVYRRQWNLLDTREDVQTALNELVEAGWLKVDTEKTGGRSREVYRVNPKVRGDIDE